jgi:hypothetical protein
MFSSMFFAYALNRAKAIVAFFLTGFATLIIQSIETGGGINIPNSIEDWIRALATAGVVALGVERVANRPLPQSKSPSQ